MAATRGTQDKGVISQISDAGEDALRRLFGLPRRNVVGALDGVAERLHDVATKPGAIDPLDGRVTAIERRLDSLEKPKKTTARTASRRAKPSRARKASTAAALEPEQGEEQGESEHARGHRADAQAENEREQDETTARNVAAIHQSAAEGGARESRADAARQPIPDKTEREWASAIPAQPAQLQRSHLGVEPRAGGLLILGVDDQQDSRAVADRAAEHDEAVIASASMNAACSVHISRSDIHRESPVCTALSSDCEIRSHSHPVVPAHALV